jgi:topoisomerase IA-like protein
MDSTPRRSDRLRVRVHQWASGLDPKTGRPIVNKEAYYGDKAVLVTPGSRKGDNSCAGRTSASHS